MEANGWLEAKDSVGCTDSKPFSITLGKGIEGGFSVPNIVTPDNDGRNDCFEVFLSVSDADCHPDKIKIFNRWGQLVFNDARACWDGTDFNSGQPLAEGVYYY